MTARLLQLLVLAGLLLAPFGRIGLAQAYALATPHGAPAAMAAHCSGDPAAAPEPGKSDRVDCMTACVAIAASAGAGPLLAPLPAGGMARVALAAFALAGIPPEAEPPPPRLS